EILRSRGWSKGLSTADATELHIWIVRQFPLDEDPQDRGHGAHVITPRHTLADLRDAILGELSSRGTLDALAAIERIQREFPQRDLTPYIQSARDAAAQSTWTPRTPREILELRSTRGADAEPMTLQVTGRKPPSSTGAGPSAAPPPASSRT